MKSTVAILALVGGAFAASNPLIPSGISSGCSSFMTTLDSDSTLQSCTNPLITASSAFGPLSSNSSSKSVNTALSTLCASENACDAGYVRNQLTSFYAACSSDMASSADVQRAYDTLYALAPFVQAVCEKDDSNNYCVSSLTSSSASNSSAKANFASQKKSVSIKDLYTTIKTSLRRRATSTKAASQVPLLIPNTTTFASQNILFLALTPSSPSSQLCSACSKSILTSYATFEQNTPYAGSMSSSQLFSGQSDLFSAVSSQCGADFVGGNGAQAAGGLKGSTLSGGAGERVKSAGMGVMALVAVVAGAMLA